MGEYEKVNTNAPPNPIPYSDQQPQNVTNPQQYPTGPVPPAMVYGTPSPMPTQWQGNYMPPGPVPGQGPILQQPQVAYFTPVQPVNEPDHLTFSILTMLFCFLPLGIAACVFSIKTRDANRMGNLTAAKTNSRRARLFANLSLAVGAGFVLLYIILVVIATTTTAFSVRYY